jgi:hypothetical protein
VSGWNKISNQTAAKAGTVNDFKDPSENYALTAAGRCQELQLMEASPVETIRLVQAAYLVIRFDSLELHEGHTRITPNALKTRPQSRHL